MSPTSVGRHHRSRVVALRWVTPRIIRVTLTAGAPEALPPAVTDSHLAFYFYPEEAIVPDFAAPVVDTDALSTIHDFAAPQVRRYTVRSVDPEANTMDVDVVVHEPAGLASAWARDVELGDELLWWGPTDAWSLPPGVSSVVLVADESGLPGVDAILTGLPAGVQARVIAEVHDATDETYLAEHLPRAEITWVHRGSPTADVPDELAGTFTTLAADLRADLRTGCRSASHAERSSVAVWAGTEFARAGALRRALLGPDGPVTKDATSITSYWIHGQAQDKRPDARNRARNLENRRERPRDAARHLRHPGHSR